VVLDAELVARAGKPEDFDGIAGRMASRRRSVPLTFVAFDVLFIVAETVCERPYYERRAALEQRDRAATPLHKLSGKGAAFAAIDAG
jgi:ATP-dependent DNA ligase